MTYWKKIYILIMWKRYDDNEFIIPYSIIGSVDAFQRRMFNTKMSKYNNKIINRLDSYEYDNDSVVKERDTFAEFIDNISA